MAWLFRELGLDTFTSIDEETPDLLQPSSYLGPFGGPSPVSQTVDQQCLHLGDLLQNDSFFEGLSTTAAPILTLENNPFAINHDAFEPWPHVSTSSPRVVSCREPEAADSTGSEPTQPATKSPKPTRGNESRVKKKTSSDQQGSAQPDDIHRNLRCPYSDCKYDRPFSTKYTLSRHIKAEHENAGAFKCLEPKCDKVFKRKDGRVAHFRNKHWKEQLPLQSHGS